MSLIPTIYSSTDPGAPQLSGTAGSLISVLRAVLVNGYGTAPNAKPGLGWSEQFSGANVTVLKNNPSTGTGYNLRLDDSNDRYGLLRGFSVMSDLNTGLDPTPGLAEVVAGIIWPKSTLANATVRPWFVIGTETAFYLFVDVGGLGLDAAVPYFAGDLTSMVPSDQYCFAISHGNLTNYSGGPAVGNLFGPLRRLNTTPTLSTSALAVARKGDQSPGAVWVSNCEPSGGLTPASYGAVGQVDYPAPASGSLLYDRPILADGLLRPRGFFPGLYVPLHAQPLADLSQLADPEGLPSGTVFLAKSFRTQSINISGNSGQCLFDLTGAW